MLAIEENQLSLDPDDACDAILDGYPRRSTQGGCPFVLAQQHRWLRDMARSSFAIRWPSGTSSTSCLPLTEPVAPRGDRGPGAMAAGEGIDVRSCIALPAWEAWGGSDLWPWPTGGAA